MINQNEHSRILIVDDDADSLDIIKLVFQIYNTGYHIDILRNPLEVPSYLESKHPNLLITDWDMPQQSGIDLIKYVRSIAEYKNLPILMITGKMISSENLTIALQSGANDFLRKPFEKSELIARVRTMLQIADNINKIENQNIVLAEHIRFINSLIASIPEPMVYYNKEGIIMGHNASFENIFKLEMFEFKGTLIYNIFENPYDEQLKTKRLLESEHTQDKYEAYIKTPNRTDPTPFIVSKTVFKNFLNEPEGIICIFTDITQLKDLHKIEMEEKKKALIASATQLIQISEMNYSLLKELEMLKNHVDAKGKELIVKLMSKYDLKTLELSWKDFDMRFQSVYEDFYKKLSVLHPDLTPNEKRICGLLRLNLSSKDIAILTFNNAKSVDMARYRLRKKLNLSQEDNLINYLLSL